MLATAVRNSEGKYRTSAEVKAKAAEVYARWGLSLSDAINVFLVKSIEVGGLPFAMRQEPFSYGQIASMAYKAPLDENGVVTLPADWDDDDE